MRLISFLLGVDFVVAFTLAAAAFGAAFAWWRRSRWKKSVLEQEKVAIRGVCPGREQAARAIESVSEPLACAYTATVRN